MVATDVLKRQHASDAGEAAAAGKSPRGRPPLRRQQTPSHPLLPSGEGGSLRGGSTRLLLGSDADDYWSAPQGKIEEEEEEEKDAADAAVRAPPPPPPPPQRIHIADVCARGLAYTRQSRASRAKGATATFFVAFELPGLAGQPRGSTLAARASANPAWESQIVTLPLGGGAAAASSQLLLRVVLCEQREDGRGGAVPVGVAEATVDPRYPAVVGPLELKGATLRHALIAFSMRGEQAAWQADAA